ncbi:hypothetical protein RO787_28740 [Blautia coccoides]|uniref:hypothetical protein n=1 Tax=Blautia producta TaxID=33035 RepID=UPI0028A41B98|nr:hypothetical protein [Blautia coccoides]MDT4377302.1 hypothetical protein [Blautia coccoides]
MFYKQFSTITDILNPEFVENFDFWLATLPENNKKNITASVVSSRLGVKYSLADSILKFAEKQRILGKYYLVKCPDCDYNLGAINQDEIADILLHPVFCDECEEHKRITVEDIYMAYKVLVAPDTTEEEIARAIEKRINKSENNKINFLKADSLSNDVNTIYCAFYNPSESAYDELKKLRGNLDMDYGKNTTAKGGALETLVLNIFNEIKGVTCSNDVETKTNQFDCTGICGVSTHILSIFNYLSPYFIIECKNEPNKAPTNTYCNKLLSIMDTNEAQVGIIWGRKNATKPCFEIAREHYIKHSANRKQQIIMTFSDEDLDNIIDRKVNLLMYLDYKLMQVTTNSPDAKFEKFVD